MTVKTRVISQPKEVFTSETPHGVVVLRILNFTKEVPEERVIVTENLPSITQYEHPKYVVFGRFTSHFVLSFISVGGRRWV